MAIKTNKFTENLVNRFLDDFTENNYYIFGSDYNLSQSSENTNFSKIDFLEKTIFGKRLTSNDFSFMIRNVVWQSGNVYDEYDDRVNLQGKNYYVVVEPDTIEGGNYYVFKCLSNNQSAPSTQKPTFNPFLFEENLNYNLSDGYIWKHVSTIPSSIVSKFATRGYFPIIRNQFIEDNANDGIEIIKVENPNANAGYEKKTGNVLFDVTNDGVVTLQIDSGQDFQGVPGFYNNRCLFVEKSTNSQPIGARRYKIINSALNSNDELFVEIEGYDPSDFEILKGDDFQILPFIEIQGSGSGAEAIPIFDATNTFIESVEVISEGTGYQSATAEVLDPVNFSVDTGDIVCELRPIISPENGHGKNIVDELRVRHICLSTVFSSGDNSNIPTTNNYSKIGLVRNPTITNNPLSFDNRLVINVNATTGLSIGETIFQTNGATGVIHALENDKIYVINYSGPYPNNFDDSLALKSQFAGDFSINSIDFTDYTERSGDVLYMTDFTPINRTESTVEQIKILIDF